MQRSHDSDTSAFSAASTSAGRLRQHLTRPGPSRRRNGPRRPLRPDGGSCLGRHRQYPALPRSSEAVFPDFHVETGPLRHGDDHVLVEVRLTGTQHADWAGIPNTGRSFDTRFTAVFDFEGDQMVQEHVYLDFADISRQLTVA